MIYTRHTFSKKGKEQLKTRAQIADELGVSYATLRRRIKKAGMEIEGNLIAPSFVKKIKALFYIY